MFYTFSPVLELPPLLFGIISQLFSSFETCSWFTYVPMFVLNGGKLSAYLFSFSPERHLILYKPRNQKVWCIMTLGMSAHVQNWTFPHVFGFGFWGNWKNRLQNRLYSNTPMLVWSSCDQNVVILSQVTSKIHVGEINVTFTGGCIDSGIDFDIIWLREGF